MNEIIITKVINTTSKGVSLELNYPARLKSSSGLASKTWFISWDRIGCALFDGYTERNDVKDLTDLRQKGGGQ